MALVSTRLIGTDCLWATIRQLALYLAVFFAASSILVLTRSLVHPTGLFCLLTLYLSSYLVGFWKGAKLNNKRSAVFVLFTLWTACFALMPFAGWQYKESLFRLGVYYVPSGSMSPTLILGDYVLVDLSKNNPARLNVGDIIVYSRKGSSLTYIKRAISVSSGSISVRGDNPGISPPSGSLGTIAYGEVVGVAELIATNPGYPFSRTLKRLR